MNKVTLKIDGMSCSMCESHVCEAIRRAVEGKIRVSASHRKGTAQILMEDPPDVAQIKAAVNATGYTVTDVTVTQSGRK